MIGRNKFILMFILGLAIIISHGVSDSKGLPPPYKKWLEEVVYIISPVEKEVFLKLNSNQERDQFIKAFWKHRDPTPHTEENEYKKEHFRRIEYANQYFGRETPKQGWKTDRGRLYIILGEPDDIQTFDTKNEIYPTQIWFYQGMEDKGLPQALQLVFFQDKGRGEYKLYSPLNQGPQSLLTSLEGNSADVMAAYEKIKRIEPSLANATLTLIPGEKPTLYGRPHLSSEHLLNEIETTPLRNVNGLYARKYLKYKDKVEVEYSTNYILNFSTVKTTKNHHGVNFIHYALEPERLSIDTYQDKYYTVLELYGRVSDMKDRLIYQFEKTIPLEFNESQINQIENRPFNVLDMFPMIPGQFKLSILMKNKTSKEFTSLEKTLLIPDQENPIQMSPLILAYGIKEADEEEKLTRPFQIKNYQLYPPLNRMFVKDSLLVIAYQIHGIDVSEEKNFKLRYTFFKNGEKDIVFTKDISEYPEKPVFIEKVSLRDFSPDHYMLRVSFFEDQTEIISSNEEFEISHSDSIPRPWYYTIQLSKTEDPDFSHTLGLQYFRSGDLEKALPKIKSAYEKNKDSEEIALNLARIYISKQNYTPVKSILTPFINQEKSSAYQTYFLLALSYKNLKKFKEAVSIYRKALSEYGTSPELLNPLGDCLLQLEKKKEALEAWEKSLQINPHQPQIREKINSIKKSSKINPQPA
ncbi:MAG: GWxTD domain-containing protein [Acidobacteriota bacterium]